MSTPDSAADRVVLVTGASSGIGAAVVRRIAGPDTRLVLHARKNAEGLSATAEAATVAGATVATLLADLSETSAASRLVALAADRFGRLDQVVANAGFADRRLFGEVGADDLARAHRTMVDAFLRVVDRALPHLQSSAWGRVVAVSSFVAHWYRRDRLFPTTAAAKAGLEALAKALAAQLAPTGTTVNCVAPGFTRKEAGGHSAMTPEAWRATAALIPLGRLAEPDDVAAVIAFLLGRDAGYITGQVIHVDGGLTLG